MSNFELLAKAVEEGDDEKVVDLVTQDLANGEKAIDILEKGLVPGIQALGKLFKDGKVYLPEILISIRAMDKGVELVEPLLSTEENKSQGTVILGSVAGDMHDIGKDLVKMMLNSNGFEVIDLGVDVPTERFVGAIKENNADIVAMSSLLTTTMPEMSTVIEAITKAGLRQNVKCMIGGAPVNREFADSIGCEGYAEDCASAVDEAIRLMNE